MSERVRAVVGTLLPEAEDLLCDAIRFTSISGEETELMTMLESRFGTLRAEVERAPMSNALREDPDYSSPILGLSYDGRFNLRVRRPGLGAGRAVLLNAHADVVPPSEGMDRPWTPRVRDGVVYGRGACDAKGQIALLYLVLRTLDELGLPLRGDVVAHLVAEEENGGNGTLAMVRRGESAEACVVLEPTDGRLMTSVRGAVWFRLTFSTSGGHSGRAGRSPSALLMAREAMGILEAYHADLLAASRGIAPFNHYDDPMPLTFGRLQAGNWPAASPSRAVLEGVLGLLPNRTRDEVCAEVRHALRRAGFADECELEFTYRHDSSVLDPRHELPTELKRAARKVGLELELDGMPASCDAWLYNNQLGIPTVVYGPGSLTVAHSRNECLDMRELARAAEVLVTFLAAWCGPIEV